MLLPPEFRRYFALPGCRAGQLGLDCTSDGRRLCGTDMFYPRFRCPPMGCSCSPRICRTMLGGHGVEGAPALRLQPLGGTAAGAAGDERRDPHRA
eukprot:3739209-Pyramimonas_sp.AAC.1